MKCFENSPILSYNRLVNAISTANEMANQYWACKQAADTTELRHHWANAYDDAKDAGIRAENSLKKLMAYYS